MAEIGLVHFAPAEAGSAQRRVVDSVKCLDCGQAMEWDGLLSVAEAEQLLSAHFAREGRSKDIGETTLLGRAPHHLERGAALETLRSSDNPDIAYIRSRRREERSDEG